MMWTLRALVITDSVEIWGNRIKAESEPNYIALWWHLLVSLLYTVKGFPEGRLIILNPGLLNETK